MLGKKIEEIRYYGQLCLPVCPPICPTIILRTSWPILIKDPNSGRKLKWYLILAKIGKKGRAIDKRVLNSLVKKGEGISGINWHFAPAGVHFLYRKCLTVSNRNKDVFVIFSFFFHHILIAMWGLEMFSHQIWKWRAFWN